MRIKKNFKQGHLDLTVDMALQEFWQWALSGTDDIDAERLFVEWMVGRLLALPKYSARRVSYDNEYLHLPNGVVVDLNVGSSDDDDEHRYFAFCTPLEIRTRPRKPWRPEDWSFHLFSMHELVEADVLDSVLLENFIAGHEPMTPTEFRLVAKSKLGLKS
jgi:hypothetical protein